jgi:hypothetical protein
LDNCLKFILKSIKVPPKVRGFENVGTYLGLALIRMALIPARL